MVHAGTRPRRELGPAVFRPPRLLGAAVALVAAAGALVLAVLAFRAAATGDADLKTFSGWFAGAVLLVLAGTFVNWAHGVMTLAYVVDGDALTIRWGFRRVVIPLDTILRLVPGRTLDTAHVHGLNWPGCHIGHADVKRIGYTLFYSTHRSQQEILVVHTTQESYALAVLDQAAFAEEVQGRAALAPLESHPQRSAATGIAAIPFWRDGVAIMSALGAIAACAVLCAFVSYRYPDLPEVIQINFPGTGTVARIGEKAELLKIAYLGAGALIANLTAGIVLHARERAAGLWLLASGGLIQVILLAAAIAAIERS